MYRAFREESKPTESAIAPTLLDLTIDDNLSEFDRVVKYCRSHIGLQRYVIYLILNVMFIIEIDCLYDVDLFMLK